MRHGAAYTFSNPASISMNESNNTVLTLANPYPSTITVTGLTNQLITNVTVTLNGFSHDSPSDVNILLIGPTGLTALLMADCGGQDLLDPSVTNLTLTFDDNSIYLLPINDVLYSGTFQPGANPARPLFDLPPPAPAGNSNADTDLSLFGNTDPDGTWSLFIVDDASTAGITGSISGGWSLSISTGVPLQIAHSRTNVILSWPVITNQTLTLQSAITLTNASAWTNVPGSAVQVGGRNLFTNAVSNVLNAPRFYRLIGP